ncbi:hypothetical protein B566_EDAN016555 [Ephemera danica]|nr:hypothetical protein B566_EDAN016555 [Ephemera danica]
MLTETQKDNLAGLLYLLQPEDITSLTNTVTNNLITPVDYEEAVSTILQYTESVTSLLNRKKITKELVFRYLHQNQVDGVSPQMDKRAMIELLMSHWGEKDPRTQIALPSVPVSPPQDESQVMAETFAQWFYTLMNLGMTDSGQKFGPEHFWPDCRLHVHLENSSLQVDQSRDNGEESAALLAELRSHFNLTFNPNISPEGVQTMSEPHGAVVVTVCGTLHQGDKVMGLFKQKFLLLRDPTMQNNWRIKRSEMVLTASMGGRAVAGGQTLAAISQ